MSSIKIRQDFLFTSSEVYDFIHSRPERFYVYVLVNPISREPIYVGKGQGDRCLAHWKWRNEQNTRIRKELCSLYRLPIRLFPTKLKEPLYFLYGFYDNEQASFNAESGLIIKWGRKHLDVNGILFNSDNGIGEKAYSNTWETVLSQFLQTHGNRYDYSKTEYKGYNYGLTVICRKHGEFSTDTGRHRKGQGCPKCGTESSASLLRKSQSKFIEEARDTHGDKYDYSKSVYKTTNEDIEIICSKHGSFYMSPYRHCAKGQGCPTCSKLDRNQIIGTEDLISRSKEIHGDRYDYSKLVYVDSYTDIEVVCKEHGSFWLSPYAHAIRGTGCLACLGRNRTTEDVVNQLIEVHGDKYDYSKVKYITAHDEIEIVCPKHGSFWQLPRTHQCGCGCPKCSGKKRTTEEAIAELKSKMGDNYSFEKTVYTKSTDDMVITCKKHGDFYLSYNRIMSSGRGCPICGMERLKEPRSLK
jgi:hypothetical protein